MRNHAIEPCKRCGDPQWAHNVEVDYAVGTDFACTAQSPEAVGWVDCDCMAFIPQRRFYKRFITGEVMEGAVPVV